MYPKTFVHECSLKAVHLRWLDRTYFSTNVKWRVYVTWWGLISAHRGYHRVHIKEQDYRTVLGLKITVGSKRRKCSPLNTVYDKLCAVIVVPVMIWLFDITVAIILEQCTYLSKTKYKTNNTQLTKLVMVLINPPDACSSIAACFLNKQIQTVLNLAFITTLYFIKAQVSDLYLL